MPAWQAYQGWSARSPATRKSPTPDRHGACGAWRRRRDNRGKDAAGQTTLIRHGRNRDDLDDEIRVCERHNPDDFRRRGIVVTAVLRTIAGKEFVQYVQTEIGRTQYASIGERPLHKEGKPDQMVERGAEFLQIGLYVREYVPPLCRRVPYGTTSLFEWIVIVSGCRIAGQKDKSFRACDDCALAPWHQTVALPLLVSHELQFSLQWFAARLVPEGKNEAVISVVPS